jgi:hypothetical protein
MLQNRQKAIKKLTMNPEAESANNEGEQNRQKPPLKKTNNEPRGRIRQQRREQCYKQAETAI